jgi:hypothetical protein
LFDARKIQHDAASLLIHTRERLKAFEQIFLRWLHREANPGHTQARKFSQACAAQPAHSQRNALLPIDAECQDITYPRHESVHENPQTAPGNVKHDDIQVASTCPLNHSRYKPAETVTHLAALVGESVQVRQFNATFTRHGNLLYPAIGMIL